MHRSYSTGAVCIALGIVSVACFRVRSSEGGGQAVFDAPRQFDPSDIAVPRGYEVDLMATHLTYPTDVAFDDQGRMYVTEAGYSYGTTGTTARLLRVDSRRGHTEIARSDNPPWNGVEFHDGAFYIGGGHSSAPGEILRVSMDGQVEPIAEGLPSYGDHHTNGPIVHDGWVYWGNGTATNSGVVGLDNFDFGWVKEHPRFHDVPCQDLELRGLNYTTENPLTPQTDEAVTGAYLPFGTASEPGQVVKGQIPCSGSVMRVRPDGSSLELVAWGFRNPFALATDPTGQIYVTENQFDVRGSRPVFGTGDLLWKLEPGRWYGWPDFFSGTPLSEEGFEPPDYDRLQPVLASHPEKPPRAAAVFAVHSSSNGFDFSTNSEFGYVGEAFVAQFGDMAPSVGKVLAPVGFKVVRANPNTGIVEDFAVNRGEENGPASFLESGGFERPISAVFGPGGRELYVVDFGVLTTRDGVMRPKEGTGSVWRIRRTETK